jgi:hypothetical protein
LFHSLGGKGYEEVTGAAASALARSEVSRGAAFGDVDNDGDTDVLIVNNNGPACLLLNRVGNRKGWLGIRLVGGADAPSDSLGARVEFVRRDGASLWRRVHTDGSYASASDPRLLVGLGDSADVEQVRVQWPNGSVEEFSEVPPERYSLLRQGTGKPWPVEK